MKLVLLVVWILSLAQDVSTGSLPTTTTASGALRTAWHRMMKRSRRPLSLLPFGSARQTTSGLSRSIFSTPKRWNHHDNEGGRGGGGFSQPLRSDPFPVRGGLIARGDTSSVFLLFDPISAEPLATKFVESQDPEQLEWEIEMLTSLKSPHIVRIRQPNPRPSGVSDPSSVIFLEYADLGDLKTFVERYGPLGEYQALDIFYQILEGYEAVKAAGIVHMDIHPGNILLFSSPLGPLRSTPIAKLSDFDSSLPVNSVIRTPTADTLSHTLFAPVEYLQGAHSIEVTDKLDFYGFGAVLYYMLTGETFLPGKVIWEVGGKFNIDVESRSRLPAHLKHLESIIYRLTDKNPSKRFSLNARDLKKWVDAIRAREAASARSMSQMFEFR